MTLRGAPLVVLLLVGGALAGCSGSDESPALVRPIPAPAAAPERAAPGPAPVSARLTRTTMLRDAPGGKMLTRLTRRTEFDGETVLAVARREQGWLGVRTHERPNGKLGWIPADAARLERQPYRLRIDLSRRELVVVDNGDGKLVRRAPVAIGAPGTPTPTGNFGVTDRIEPKTDTGPYGCCILALSGRQPNLPQGWGGGDRLAIHATSNEASVGSEASSGCLRATEETMRELMKLIPLGAPVEIVR
ncbi:MAG TPA: L,D-transpeptidase [Solirubrobacteraceae bacterium]|nr:L,D-transpeptidase [Solirubrobacteraceae bacterium]